MNARTNVAAALERIGGPLFRALSGGVSSGLSAAGLILGIRRGAELRRAAELRRELAVRSLLDSGLFDTQFYAAQSGVTPDPEACARDYVLLGASAGYLANRLFDSRAYLAHHPDVAAASFEPFLHLVIHGLREARRTSIPQASLAAIACIDESELVQSRVIEQARRRGWNPETASAWAGGAVAVYASSLGNFFFTDQADRVARALRSDGIRVHRLDQNSERPPSTTVDFFVAPHEFFYLGAGTRWRSSPVVSRSIVLNTEQPGTTWYFLGLACTPPDATVVHLSPQVAVLLRRMGRETSAYLPLGWYPDAHWPDDGGLLDGLVGLETLSAAERQPATPTTPWQERPIDILFLGSATERRHRALARLAPTLSKYRCFIHMPSMRGRPLTSGLFGVRQSLAMARRAKILLNVHRDDLPYFEWHRIVMMGLQQGALVLSEPCWPLPGIQPNRHFLASSVDDMPVVLDEMLCAPPNAEPWRAMAAATSALRKDFDLRAELRALAFLHTSWQESRRA